MARGWFGAVILLVFLGLGFVAADRMEKAHQPTEKLLKQAADPHAFAVFACGEAPGNDLTAIVSRELRIVLFK
jgi:hypothetical protein